MRNQESVLDVSLMLNFKEVIVSNHSKDTKIYLRLSILLMTPWIAAYQAPLPMGFSRQEYWSGVPVPSPTNPTGARIK